MKIITTQTLTNKTLTSPTITGTGAIAGAFTGNLTGDVNGDVYVTLHPFRFELNGISSENDLMNNVFGTYGEINNKWSAEDAKGFIKIASNQNKIYQYVNEK